MDKMTFLLESDVNRGYRKQKLFLRYTWMNLNKKTLIERLNV